VADHDVDPELVAESVLEPSTESEELLVEPGEADAPLAEDPDEDIDVVAANPPAIPRKAPTLSTPAATRDRAAAWRRLDVLLLSSMSPPMGRDPGPQSAGRVSAETETRLGVCPENRFLLERSPYPRRRLGSAPDPRQGPATRTHGGS
jgi:hypothetical protein